MEVNAPVKVVLQNSSGSVSQLSEESLSVDSEPVQIEPVEPRPGAIIANRRPAIVARFVPANTVAPNSIVFKVNGQNVTEMAQITGSAIKYVPPLPLPGNVINVSIQLTDLSGSRQAANWEFAVERFPPGYRPPAYPPAYRRPLTPLQQEERTIDRGVNQVINRL
jgi:hypothetical protein